MFPCKLFLCIVILCSLQRETFATGGGNCNCATLQCLCCLQFQYNQTTQTACLNINYNPSSLTLTVQILYNNENVITRNVGPSSFPFCVPVPSTPISFCLTARQIMLKPTSAKVCITFSVRVGPLTVAMSPFPCLTFSDGQVVITSNK